MSDKDTWKRRECELCGNRRKVKRCRCSDCLEDSETGREAVIEAESEQAVREFFDDAKRRDFESVRGFELVKVEQQS